MDPIDADDLQAIPQALRDIPQWVAWALVERHGRLTKVPINPRTGEYARVNDPSSWGTFEQACAASCTHAGVGIVLTCDCGITGIDLDHCMIGRSFYQPWAWAIVERFASYTEVTPSGEGLRIFVRGRLPEGRRRKGQIELYDTDRFFTVTGDRVESVNGEIEDRQEELTAFHHELFPARIQTHNAVPSFQDDDETVLAKAFHARNSEKFSRLWEGNTSGYDSASEADLALCSMLAYWTSKNGAQMDRLFRRSRLMRPKWDARDGADLTYGTRTILRALI